LIYPDISFFIIKIGELPVKIGLDFDGVIADSQALKAAEVLKRYGVKIPPALCKLDQVLANNWLTSGQYREIQRIVSNVREIALRAKLVPQAAIFIRRLAADGHQLSIVSSRQGAEIVNAKEWLFLKRIGVEIIGVGYGNSKETAVRGLDIFIDDDLPKLADLAGILPNLFLFSWPYNLNEREAGIAKRVFSWRDFYLAIRKINS